MAIDTVTPRSRRAVLVGAVGGLAAVAAQAIGKSGPTLADTGDKLILGQVEHGDRQDDR